MWQKAAHVALRKKKRKNKSNVAFLSLDNFSMKFSLLRGGRGSPRLVLPEKITDMVQRKIYKITLKSSLQKDT